MLLKLGEHGTILGQQLLQPTSRANAFAIFVKGHRKWTSPELTSTSIALFKARMEEYGYSSSVVLPHGNYLINLGNVDE